MTAAVTRPAEGDQRPGRAGRLTPPLTMIGLVLLGAAMPLYRNSVFYYWDDTAAVAVPVWQRMGEAIGQGRFPLLELDMWRGGNFAAEVATGMWNPVEVLLAILTERIDNVAVAITVVKLVFLVMFSLGTYLLAREYGAKPWVAAAVGAAIPLSGYVLFMDGTSWINGIITYGFMPYVWWTARRTARAGKSAVWVVVAGYLACTTGNPYELVSMGLCILAVMIEAWLVFDRKRVLNLMAAGAAVVLLNVIVYLPFALTASVSYRRDSRTLNDGFLAPQLQDFLAMSNPALQPMVNIWSGLTPTFPALYLAWFVLPLVPWLRWRVLKERRRELMGLYFYTAAYTLLVLGPSQLSVFRWPMRLVPFLFLPLVVGWAVVASQGLQRTGFRARMIASLAIVAVGGYLGWAALPSTDRRQTVTAVLVAVMVVLLVKVGVDRFKGFAVMAVGTLAFLAAQLYWFPGNYSVTDYRFPTSEKLLEERFSKRYEGMTIQIADLGKVDPNDKHPDGAYRDLTFGSNYSLAGVETLTAYSGVGFNAMDAAMCTAYQGSTWCPEAWSSLWKTPAGADRPLADLLRAQTVVVQNTLIDTRDFPAPAGWRKAESTNRVVVWERVDPLPYSGGRLSSAPSGVRIESDRMTGDVAEEVRFSGADGGSLVFARLAWPGYEATIDGKAVPVRLGPAGLVTVDLPAGVDSGTLKLDWVMPGLGAGLISGAAGLLITLVLGVADVVGRRRRKRDEPTTDRPEAGKSGEQAPLPVGAGEQQ
ncbi:hypothetical protein GCM10010492_43930 [Saccharothrix mutabilis subsp. mutabilis]|uniref:YfhO family protein n=1 Tax=Saccharothrix mutabilis subsp. mutabilis TaxID=66855 RepID=A0ABN0U634_9PSEU